MNNLCGISWRYKSAAYWKGAAMLIILLCRNIIKMQAFQKFSMTVYLGVWLLSMRCYIELAIREQAVY